MKAQNQNIINKSEEKIIEDIYNKALDFFNSKDYVGTIYALEEIAKTNVKSKELLEKATQALVEVFYNEALEYKNKKKYHKLAKLIDKTKQFNFNKEQEKIFDTFTQDVNNILETESKELYNKANDCYNKNDLQNAFRYINDSYNLLNNEYNERFLEQILQLEQKIVEAKENLSKEYFDKAIAILEKRENGTLEDARDCAAMALEYNNEIVCRDLLNMINGFINNANINFSTCTIKVLDTTDKILMRVTIPTPRSYNDNDYEYDKYEEEVSKLNQKTIVLETATKEELLTIDGFDNQKAEKFLSERENGKKYYNLEAFVMDYELQPHQMIMLEDKIIFSQKPNSKWGRKVDF